MIVNQIKMVVKRDIRHAPYNVSSVSVELTSGLDPADDLEESYKELHEDAVIIVEEMVEKEKQDYKESLDERRNKRTVKG